MNSFDLHQYLKQKTSPRDIKKLIAQRIDKIAKKFQNKSNNTIRVEINDVGKKQIVTANQFVNLLNDYINGDISKFELHFILNAIEQSEDLIVENPDAIRILYHISSPLMKYPLSLNYIKSIIYRP